MPRRENPFSADTYIRQRHARSVLCLPLINQAKLIGLLYLENNLTPHVFTPTRISVLKLLASQAAISLENTRLYTDEQQNESLPSGSAKAQSYRQLRLVSWHWRNRLVRGNVPNCGIRPRT